MDLPKDILKKLGLSAIESDVYAAMIAGHTKVKDIQGMTGIKRPSVYYAIANLEKRGLIGRLQVGEYNTWKVSSLARLRNILDEKKIELAELSDGVEEFIAHAPRKESTSKTKVTYYEGQESIEHIVFNSVYCKSKEIWSIAPNNNFFFEVGSEFATKYVTERKHRGIKTRNLWEEVFDEKVVEKLYEGISEIRIMPEGMHGKFRTTTFIYDDKVMYIAPLKSNYAVIFQSKEHVAMMRSLYETVWNISEKI